MALLPEFVASLAASSAEFVASLPESVADAALFRRAVAAVIGRPGSTTMSDGGADSAPESGLGAETSGSDAASLGLRSGVSAAGLGDAGLGDAGEGAADEAEAAGVSSEDILAAKHIAKHGTGES